jgi:hypothetical protein
VLITARGKNSVVRSSVPYQLRGRMTEMWHMAGGENTPVIYDSEGLKWQLVDVDKGWCEGLLGRVTTGVLRVTQFSDPEVLFKLRWGEPDSCELEELMAIAEAAVRSDRDVLTQDVSKDELCKAIREAKDAAALLGYLERAASGSFWGVDGVRAEPGAGLATVAQSPVEAMLAAVTKVFHLDPALHYEECAGLAFSDLVDIVAERVVGGQVPQPVFRAVCESLRAIPLVQCEVFTADSSLEEMLEKPSIRREVWRKLREEFGKSVPKLRFPFWASMVAAGAGLVVGTVVAFVVYFGITADRVMPGDTEEEAQAAAFAGLIPGSLLFIAAQWLLGNFCRYKLPDNCRDVRGLVRCIARRDAHAIAMYWERKLSWGAVDKQIRAIAGEVLGVSASEVKRFYMDWQL